MGRTVSAAGGVAENAFRACSESAGPLAANPRSDLTEVEIAVGDLRWIARFVVEIDHPSAKRFVTQLGDYEAGNPFGLSLDKAMRLVPGDGGEKWWRTEDRKRRDMLLCGIARDFYSDEPSEWRQAELIADRLARFKTNVWPRYRTWKRLPDRYAGKIEERLFLVLKCDRDDRGMIRGNARGAKTIRRALVVRV
jgi:hypothetical protein